MICEYCNMSDKSGYYADEDIYAEDLSPEISSGREEKVAWVSLSPSRKNMQIYVEQGEVPFVREIEIGFCPMCGRKL